ncbi:hypothetical protein [Phytoactinopolyspora endophytica]|nr:hypothetical protein [Phytoactinopolyspora endophytica]
MSREHVTPLLAACRAGDGAGADKVTAVLRADDAALRALGLLTSMEASA